MKDALVLLFYLLCISVGYAVGFAILCGLGWILGLLT